MPTIQNDEVSRGGNRDYADSSSPPQRATGDASSLFRAVLISGEDGSYTARFMPRDPQWSYWTALEAAYDYLDAMYPRWFCIAASREFYPEYVRIDFTTGGLV
jgi:hypothetical protein